MKLTLDTKSFKDIQLKAARLTKEAAAKAINDALAKASKVGQTSAKRAITSEYNVKPAEVAERLTVTLDAREQVARIKARYSKQRYPRIPLIKFNPRDTKKTGVYVKIKKGGARQKLRHAFIATMPNGHTGVYQRVQGTRKIKEVVTIDIATMFNARKTKRTVIDRVGQVMQPYMMHEIQRALSRAGFKQ